MEMVNSRKAQTCVALSPTVPITGPAGVFSSRTNLDLSSLKTMRPLVCKEIQPVHPKGDQSWVFTGRTDAEAETPIVWPPHAKS